MIEFEALGGGGAGYMYINYAGVWQIGKSLKHFDDATDDITCTSNLNLKFHISCTNTHMYDVSLYLHTQANVNAC